jgi:hypothetical protein
MAALDMSLIARSEYALAQLAKRDNWAQREPGVIVVLVIVFLVLCLLIGVFISKRVCSSNLISFGLVLTSTFRSTATGPHKIPPSRGEVEVNRKSESSKDESMIGYQTWTGKSHTPV